MKLLIAILVFTTSVLALELGIGTVSGKPQSKIVKFKAVAEYLEEQLKPHGVTRVYTRFAPDMESMAERIRQQEVHLFFDSIFATVYMMEKAGSKPVLRRWKKGVATYESILLSRADSHIKSLDDIKGRTIGFEDTFSSSGYFVPKMDLILKGYVFQFQGTPDPERIRYDFSGGEDDKSSVYQLIKKHFDVVATNNGFFDNFKNRDQFHVLYRSEKIPRHIASTANIPETLEKHLVEVLMGMDSNDKGKKALKAFDKTKKMDALDEDTRALIASYREKLPLFRQ